MVSLRHPAALVLLVALLLVAAWTNACRHELASCELCGRGECRNMTLVVTRADGSRQQTCCARCGARAVASDARPVTSIRVRDFDTAAPIDVERAVFVEASDIHPCRGMVSNPPLDERGCCLKTVYDRCEPSVVAFASADAAGRFMERHGGTRTTWAALIAGVGAGS